MIKGFRAVGLAVAFGFACLAEANIYCFTDEQGTLHLSDAPQDSRAALCLLTSAKTTARVPSAASAKGTPMPMRRVGRQRVAALVQEIAHTTKTEAALLHAVIAAESGYDPSAVSPKGATGLMQLMPETARRYRIADPRDPAQNVLGGALYLRDLLQLFDNDLALALAAYNAGENAVIRYGHRVPPYRETSLYVPKVLELYKQFRNEPVMATE